MQFDANGRTRFDRSPADDDVRIRGQAGRDDDGDHYASAVGDDADHPDDGSRDGDGDADHGRTDDHGRADSDADDRIGDDVGVE